MFCDICNSSSVVQHKEGKFCFVSCKTCKVKYHYPIPSKEYLSNWYSKNALAKRWKGDIRNAVNANYKQSRGNYPDYLVLIKDVPAVGQRALDVGCYAGHFLTHLIKSGFSGTGIDLNGGLVEYGKKTFGIDLRQGDVFDEHFDSNYFGLVTCHQLLEHTRNPYDTIKEIYRILSPGGFVAISVPDASCNNKITYPEHLFHFTQTSLECLFRRLSFTCTVTKSARQKALFALGRKPDESR